MQLRRVLGGAALALGGVAGANRLLSSSEPLPPALDGTQHTYRWRGFDIAYTDAGDPDADDLVLLHGIHAGASPAEFEATFDALAEEYHVLAPALPGFGRSDRPPVAYTGSLYESFIRDFSVAVTENAVCLATSLSGAFAASVASEAGFSRLLLVCPTDDVGERRPWLRTLFRSPYLGTALFNVLSSKAALRYFNSREAVYDSDNVADSFRLSQHQSAHRPGARYAPASFVGGFLRPDQALSTTLETLDSPITLLWGRESTVPPLSVGRALAEEADTRLVVIDQARGLPHVEHPQRVLDALAEDLPNLSATV